jgi:hypothetical protein
MTNSMSLGVFSSAVNTQQLQVELNGQGYRSKIWNQKSTLFVLTTEVPIDDLLIHTELIVAGHVLSICD